MESILNTLESKYLTFKLGEEQREALLSVFSFIKENEDVEFCLLGKGGVGKSTITKLIVRYLEELDIPYQLAAPTHKSKKILSQMTERDAVTIHQLLALRPTIDVMDLDMKDLQFSIASTDSIPRGGIIIIDECSMINDILYDEIIKRCKDKDCKVL